MGRQETNIQGNWKISDKWSSGLFIHGNQRTKEMDGNGDSFLDAPLAKQVNILNRWQYTNANKGWVGFGSFRLMRDEKTLGSLGFNPEEDRNNITLWGSQIDTNRIDTSLKIGYVFPELSYKSFGFQSAFSNHDQEAYYGFRIYNINQQSFYSSLLYNSIIGNTKNKFKIGINFSYDRYLETVDNFYFNRSDRSIGSFLEYTYNSLENFNLVAGIRLDSHNRLGTFITPRLHLRYLPKENTIFRLSAGSGRKVANIFAENQSLFGTNRQINILDNGGSIYGLNPERAWNYGLSIRQIFNIFGKRQDPDGAYAAVIPKWVASILNKEDVYINGDGETSRDFCYVDNAVQANLLSALSDNDDATDQVYNIALNDKTSLNTLYKMIEESLSRRVPNLEKKEPIYRDFRPGDVRHSQASIDKAKKLLGYQPEFRLSEGLDEALGWYIDSVK